MCGIAGWIDFRNEIQSQEQIAEKMAETLKDRGSDEGGFYSGKNVWLIHRRLSVIDPEHGKQPMRCSDGRTDYYMVYNGELYNAEELRKELKALGHQFLEHSDTEVLLHSYVQWGEDCLTRLNGIYAFAVWNEAENSLFLARDRMGVKPLFFYSLPDGILFASQIKTILANPQAKAEVDQDGLRELFFMGPGRTGGQGILRGIRELKPAEYAVLDRDGLRIKSYWSLKTEEHKDDFSTTVEKTRELILDAIKRQTVSDVPLCCFLSGGLDSSIISKVAADKYREEGQRLTTYSVDYEDNELFFKKSAFQPNSDKEYIDIMVKDIGSEHIRVVLNNEDLAKALPEAAVKRDQPGLADVDSSLLLFCREIRKNNTVGISGECADEIFGGYPWFHNEDLLNGKEFPWARSLSVRHKILLPGAIRGGDEYVQQRFAETVDGVETLDSDSEIDRQIRKMTMLNLNWFMQTLLDRKDRMSMACGLEVRVPFCDHRIVEYAYNMPWSMKAYEGREKGIVRKAMEGILPDEIIYRKKSPYPKTHNPVFMKLMIKEMKRIRKDKSSALNQLIDWKGVDEIIARPDSLPSTWYGQLMGAPQILAYLVQMDAWFKAFGVDIVNI